MSVDELASSISSTSVEEGAEVASTVTSSLDFDTIDEMVSSGGIDSDEVETDANFFDRLERVHGVKEAMPVTEEVDDLGSDEDG